MPTINDAGRRKYLSELVRGTGMYSENTGIDYHYARATVVKAVTGDVSTIGTLAVWVDANDQYEIATDASVIGTEAGSLNAKVVVIVGPKEGVGLATMGETSVGVVEIADTGTEVQVLYRGPFISLLRTGLEYAAQGIVTPATIAALEAQLQLQGIDLADPATSVESSLIV